MRHVKMESEWLDVRCEALDGESAFTVRVQMTRRDFECLPYDELYPHRDPWIAGADMAYWKTRYRVRREAFGSLVGLTWPM